MLSELSAFDVLELALVVGLVAALFGWAGGAGGRLVFSLRLDRIEGVVMTILNRAKGVAGQAKTQVQRDRFSSAEKEAEALAAKLRAAPRAGIFARKMSPIDAAEEQSFREIEAAKDAQRKGGP